MKALITLEQVNTTEWCGLFSAMIEMTCYVNCFLISGNDVISLESRLLNFRVFIHAYSLRPQTLFPVVSNTRTKSIQKQIKSIDVDKVGSNKKSLTAALCLACLEIRSRNQEASNSTRNMIYSLKVFYFLLYRRRYFLFVSKLI